MTLKSLDIDETRLSEICSSNQVKELQVFGSITGEDFDAASDVDILAKFLPSRRPNLFSFAGLKLDLTALFGRQVHLHTEAMIPPTVRPSVLKNAQVAYGA